MSGVVVHAARLYTIVETTPPPPPPPPLEKIRNKKQLNFVFKKKGGSSFVLVNSTTQGDGGDEGETRGSAGALNRTKQSRALFILDPSKLPMAPPISSLSSFLLICLLTSPSISLDSSSTCFPQSPAFLPLQCPLPFSPSSPFQMDGDSLEKILNTIPTNVYIAVLFYASWCPFSTGLKTKFDILSSMFPKIGHIAVEQSSVMPSVFSQYGVHSLPAVLLVNQREKMRYYGPKDLHSLAQFYRRTTGLDPVEDVMNDDVEKLMEQEVIQPWYRASWKEIVVKEPYLTGAIAFLVLRAVLYFSPEILTHIMAVWVSCKRHLNVGVWGEASQVVGRVLQMMDVKRGWNKLKLCKPRNLHKRAGSARAWASSLASVSLGEASSARRPSSISTDS